MGRVKISLPKDITNVISRSRDRLVEIRSNRLLSTFKFLYKHVIILYMVQKLSPTAKRAKAIRDKKAAMTPDRRNKKAENQRKRRAATKAGKDIKGKDYDHKDRRFKSVKANRGNDGQGTKKEGFNTKTMKTTSKSRNRSTKYKK